MNERHAPQPERAALHVETMPREITSRPQWVTWKYEPRPKGGKPYKAPYMPSGMRADITNPRTWCSFDNAIEGYTRRPQYSGVGFVLTKADPIVGLDLDHCLNGGQLTPTAAAVVETLDSYTEISPSGTGLRILIQAEVGDYAGKRGKEIELYNYGRYLTITGNTWGKDEQPIAPRLKELREVYKTFLQDAPVHTSTGKHVDVSTRSLVDDEVIARMVAGKFGEVYRSILAGDVSQVANQDESRADTLLFNGLAFYTGGNATQMRRILTSSPRFMQRVGKWHKPVSGDTTYLDYQIEDSIRYTATKR